MSYYLGRSDYSSYRSSYEPGKYSSYGKSSYGSDSLRSSYSGSRPSYDSSSWRNSYSGSSSSSYKPKTYDFGSSSLSSSYGSRYGDSSWRTRDFTSKDYSSKDYSSTTEDTKDYSSNNNSTEETSSKDDTTEEHSAKTGKDALVKDFNGNLSSNDEMSKEKVRESFAKEFFENDNFEGLSSKTKDPALVKDFSSTTESSGRHFSSRGSEDTSSKEKKDYLSKYAPDNKRKDYLNKYVTDDDKTSKDYQGKITNGDVKDFSQNDDISSYRDKYERHGLVDSPTKKPSHRYRDYSLDDKTTRDERTSSPNKKVYNFEDVLKEDKKDNALFAAKKSDFDDVDSYKPKASGKFNGDRHGSSYKPMESYSNQNNRNARDSSERGRYSAPQRPKNDIRYSQPKTRGRASSDSGPVSSNRPTIQKFISVVPEENRYITSVNYLPERIELRLCGTTPKDKKAKKWRSIPDLYNITLKPQQSDEEQISCEEETMAFAYDSSNEFLNYSLPKHEHMKEMYVTQYTHHFDPEEPRSHIAGWKVDVEPNGIPHERSRMCVLKHPVVSGPNKHRPPRPKSAPPIFSYRPESPEEPIRSQQVDVVNRGYYTSPRSSRPSDSVFYNGFEDSTDASSLGYAPSDDTSDSSAFLADPRSPTNKDTNFSYSKPRLIRLSAEFPGVRNLEKMRRKRQSMGSATSPRPRSSLGHSPSPRDGEYGFFVALTSGDSPKVQSKSGRSYSHY